jgi:hypothetical protein
VADHFQKRADDFCDGSYALYALYNERSLEHDKELVDTWSEHVRDLMVLVRYTSLLFLISRLIADWTSKEWSTLGGYCSIPCTVLYNIPTVL